MPRFARVVIPGCPHHITQRGNERRDLFFTAADRDVYLGLLKQYADLYNIEVLGFCLMTNHVHLVLIPDHPRSLAKLLREVQMRYSQYRHALERGNGHLWQGRYYSCPVQPERLGAVMRYVELNPVRAGLVTEAGAYAWSSAAVHLGRADVWTLLSLREWRKSWTASDWRIVLNHGQEDGGAVREATYSGRPLGSNEFVSQLERFLKRRLRRGVAGRPRKNANDRGAAAAKI
jgi:putative transposase